MPARGVTARAVSAALRRMLEDRGPGKSICPSEVARAVAGRARPDTTDPGAWRTLMPCVRAVVARLAARGEVVVLQRGRRVDPERARGPVRIAAASHTPGVGRAGKSR